MEVGNELLARGLIADARGLPKTIDVMLSSITPPDSGVCTTRYKKTGLLQSARNRTELKVWRESTCGLVSHPFPAQYTPIARTYCPDLF